MGNEFAARLKLVPKFDESDLDSFFCMFERIAMKMEWPEDEWAFLIQQVVTGKAQSVVSALSNEQSFDYWLVKDTILQSLGHLHIGVRILRTHQVLQMKNKVKPHTVWETKQDHLTQVAVHRVVVWKVRTR